MRIASRVRQGTGKRDSRFAPVKLNFWTKKHHAISFYPIFTGAAQYNRISPLRKVIGRFIHRQYYPFIEAVTDQVEHHPGIRPPGILRIIDQLHLSQPGKTWDKERGLPAQPSLGLAEMFAVVNPALPTGPNCQLAAFSTIWVLVSRLINTLEYSVSA